MIDRAHIGKRWPAHSVLVEHGRLRRYADAIGETEELFVNSASAQRAGLPDIVVPPALLFGLDLDGRPWQHLTAMGVDLSRVLHGEQTFEYHSSTFAGDVLTFETTVTDIYERGNGRLEFVVLDTAIVNQRGERVADMRCVTVVRHG